MIRCLHDGCILVKPSKLTRWELSRKLSLVCLFWTTRGMSRKAGTLAGEKEPFFWEVLRHPSLGLFLVLWCLNRPSHCYQITRGKSLVHLSHRSHRKKCNFWGFSLTGNCHPLQGLTETPDRLFWDKSQVLDIHSAGLDNWENTMEPPSAAVGQ